MSGRSTAPWGEGSAGATWASALATTGSSTGDNGGNANTSASTAPPSMSIGPASPSLTSKYIGGSVRTASWASGSTRKRALTPPSTGIHSSLPWRAAAGLSSETSPLSSSATQVRPVARAASSSAPPSTPRSTGRL